MGVSFNEDVLVYDGKKTYTKDLGNRISRPSNEEDRAFNDFIEKKYVKIASFWPRNWDKYECGTNISLLSHLERSGIRLEYVMITIIKILCKWKRGRAYVLDYKGSFKFKSTCDITRKQLHMFLIRVVCGGYEIGDKKNVHNYPATLIQKYARGYLARV